MNSESSDLLDIFLINHFDSTNLLHIVTGIVNNGSFNPEQTTTP